MSGREKRTPTTQLNVFLPNTFFRRKVNSTNNTSFLNAGAWSGFTLMFFLEHVIWLRVSSSVVHFWELLNFRTTWLHSSHMFLVVFQMSFAVLSLLLRRHVRSSRTPSLSSLFRLLIVFFWSVKGPVWFCAWTISRLFSIACSESNVFRPKSCKSFPTHQC